MSYKSTTDFLALCRTTSGGVRILEMPGLDYVVAALARAGLIKLSIGQIAPSSNQLATAWFKPALPSTSAEGVLFLWDPVSLAYEPATPALWSIFITSSSAGNVTQTITAPGPANIQSNANTVLVEQTVGAPITLVMPLSSLKLGDALISDWKGDAATNTITITLSGSDTFPGGLTSWQIASNGGSVTLRPVPGIGYAL